MGYDCAQCTAQRYPAPRGGTRRCRPTNTDGLPTRTVGRDRCVPPPCRTILGAAHFQSTASAVTTLLHFSLFHLTLTKGRRPPPAMGWERRPYGFAVGVAPSADGALGQWGISRLARRDRGRCPLDPCNFLTNGTLRRVPTTYPYPAGRRPTAANRWALQYGRSYRPWPWRKYPPRRRWP